MKFRFAYILFAFVLIACNEEQRLLYYSQDKADQFVEQYAEDFLKDEELLIYSYHPRAQFTCSKGATNSYRIFLRANEIRLFCFSDSCELKEPFNKIPLTIPNGTYTIKQDSIITELNSSSTSQAHLFEQNPVDYFMALKRRLDQYGVFAYAESKDQSFVKVWFSVQHYLIQSENIENDIKEDEILKSYNNNWYFVKMKRQMDLG